MNCSCEVPCNIIGAYETHTIIENGLVKDSRIRTDLSSDNILYLFKMFHYLERVRCSKANGAKVARQGPRPEIER